MLRLASFRSLLAASLLALAPAAAGCSGSGPESQSDDITDVPHTPVERQSIGNCWLYATATWAESMHLSATGEEFDISQSYWTYWHWFEQIVDERVSEIETGGFFHEATGIALRRGLMPEDRFVAEDATSEMSSRQSAALSAINRELESGRLRDHASRSDAALVRQVMDEAWGLSSTVKGFLTRAFGKDGQRTLLEPDATTKYTPIVSAADFAVRFAERGGDPSTATEVDTTLDAAIDAWREARYPRWGGEGSSSRRNFLVRVQRALHDRQPVVITWDVDFNAMEGSDPELRGSFNLKTLERAGRPGRQGGHMTVLEDYEAITEEYGLLKAGETLDPEDPEDADKLEALLLPSTEIRFLRIKNSWGALRDDRASAPGFPGYHDLYMDYLNGPIAWCPSVEGAKSAENCRGTTVPLYGVVLPPGY